jgi:hypothetical protein
MAARSSLLFGAMVFAGWFVANPPALAAQSLELMPFAGYRFGGDFFELIAEGPVDRDGSPALGFVLNVPLSDGMQVEALFAQQNATVVIPPSRFGPAPRWRMTVGHAQVGGLQEFATGCARPFLTGVLGLTRYAAEGDSEIRFTVGAGGGVKLFPLSHVGLRLDGRVYSTFIDADVRFLACSAGTCIATARVDVVWQAEFTAGVVFRLR